MSLVITVDMGTTNTRICLLQNEKVLDSVKKSVGAGSTGGNNNILCEALKGGIEEITRNNSLELNAVECVIACGMITSELGLCPIEHLPAPCGIEELSKGIYKASFPEICDLPFYFVRGVKSENGDFLKTDVMRGEETELLGIEENASQNCLYVLPGSHSKLILTDNKGRISEFSTQLTGELMSAVSKSTILSKAVDLKENVELDLEFLEKGYIFAKEKGLNEALFKVRILNNFFDASKPQLYGFFKGAVLQGEIDTIIKSSAKKIIIAGKRQLREPMCYLLNRHCNKEIVSIPDCISNNATAIGMVKIYAEHKKILTKNCQSITI